MTRIESVVGFDMSLSPLYLKIEAIKRRKVGRNRDKVSEEEE
jgi:hypothetical protein